MQHPSKNVMALYFTTAVATVCQPMFSEAFAADSFPDLGMQKISFGNSLVDAAEYGNGSLVNALLKSGEDPNQKGDFGSTALIRAAYRGNAEITKALLLGGANPNIADIGGATPLHIASREGFKDVVDLLVKSGANINIADSEGYTPLMRASIKGQENVIGDLLASGADANIKNSFGETAIVQAAKSNNKIIVTALLAQEEKTAQPAAIAEAVAATPLVMAQTEAMAELVPASGTSEIQGTWAENVSSELFGSELMLMAVSDVIAPAKRSFNMLDFGSYKTEDEAKKKLLELKTKQADILKGLNIVVVEKTSGDESSYHINAGLLDSKEEAVAKCKLLNAKSVTCRPVETKMMVSDLSKPKDAPLEKLADAAPSPEVAKTELPKIEKAAEKPLDKPQETRPLKLAALDKKDAPKPEAELPKAPVAPLPARNVGNFNLGSTPTAAQAADDTEDKKSFFGALLAKDDDNEEAAPLKDEKKPEPQKTPEIKAEVKPAPKTGEAKVEMKAEEKPAPTPKAAEAKIELPPQPKPPLKAEPAPIKLAEAKPLEKKPEPKIELPPEPKPVAKLAEVKPEPVKLAEVKPLEKKPEPKIEPKPELKPAPAPAKLAEMKPLEKKPEPKQIAKAAEFDDEPKIELPPQPKTSPIIEPKPEVKPAPAPVKLAEAKPAEKRPEPKIWTPEPEEEAVAKATEVKPAHKIVESHAAVKAAPQKIALSETAAKPLPPLVVSEVKNNEITLPEPKIAAKAGPRKAELAIPAPLAVKEAEKPKIIAAPIVQPAPAKIVVAPSPTGLPEQAMVYQKPAPAPAPALATIPQNPVAYTDPQNTVTFTQGFRNTPPSTVVVSHVPEMQAAPVPQYVAPAPQPVVVNTPPSNYISPRQVVVSKNSAHSKPSVAPAPQNTQYVDNSYAPPPPLPVAAPIPAPNPLIAAAAAPRQMAEAAPDSAETWIDIGYFTNQNAARGFWNRIVSGNSAALSKLRMKTKRPVNGGRVTAEVGPIYNSAQATGLCNMVASEGLSCDINQASESSGRMRNFIGGQRSSYDTVGDEINSASYNSWSVQLGTYESKEQARSSWENFRDQNRVLHGLEYQAVDASGKVRLRAGKFTSTQAAESVCEELRRNYISCIIVRAS